MRDMGSGLKGGSGGLAGLDDRMLFLSYTHARTHTTHTLKATANPLTTGMEHCKYVPGLNQTDAIEMKKDVPGWFKGLAEADGGQYPNARRRVMSYACCLPSLMTCKPKLHW